MGVRFAFEIANSAAMGVSSTWTTALAQSLWEADVLRLNYSRYTSRNQHFTEPYPAINLPPAEPKSSSLHAGSVLNLSRYVTLCFSRAPHRNQ